MGEGKPLASRSHQSLCPQVSQYHCVPRGAGSYSGGGPRLPDWDAAMCKVCCCSQMLSGSCNNSFILGREEF